MLGGAADFVVAHELSHTAADTGHRAQNGGNGGGLQAGRQDALCFFSGHAVVVDLVGILDLTAGEPELSQFVHNLHQSDQGDHGGQNVDAVTQNIRTESIAADAGDRVFADAGHQKTQHTGDQGLRKALTGDAGDQGDTHDPESKILDRSELGNGLGDELGAEQKQQRREQTAEGGCEKGNVQGLFDFALSCQGIAVKSRGNGGVGARCVQRDGGDGAAVHTADIDRQHQDNGRSGILHVVGQGKHQNDTEGDAQAGDTADDHADQEAAKNQSDVI